MDTGERGGSEEPQGAYIRIGEESAGRDETVLAALGRSGITLSAPCGGRGICGKCRVFLVEGAVRREDGTRAGPGDFFSACGGKALGNIVIALPDETGPVGCEVPGIPGGKAGTKKNVRRAGAGIDIGTTTVSAELVDLDTGESLETVSVLNAQRSFGADVMSRIGAARNGKTKDLFSLINHQTADILRGFTETWKLPLIERCTVSGNTAMLHLFAGVDPSGMGALPFTPVFLEERTYAGSDLALLAETVTLLPGISAFVGADIVSGLALLDLKRRKESAFFVDIGTNGEMVLYRGSAAGTGAGAGAESGGGNRLLCCSTAAGPCFEGAEISCGMGALPGAISAVSLNSGGKGGPGESGLTLQTIAGRPPRGICGAGLIDALAAMVRLGVIDETGALAEEYADSGFPLAEGIAIINRDIRQFQLAKSAILSGIKLLCKKAGMSLPELAAVYIAGGFGFFINKENAVIAGLLPPEFGPTKTAVCGNTSLKGAVQSLINPDFLPRCREIAGTCETLELASDPDFMDAFAENMFF